MLQFTIKQAADKSDGLFSLVHFEPKQIILTFKGKILNIEEVNKLPINEAALLLQVNKEKYLDLDGDSSFFCRHSCNANTAIKLIGNTAFLISVRAIKPNDELCFDYSLTSSDTPKEWSMACKCGSWNCRKVISGFNTLSNKDKETYIKLGIVPNYISKQQ